MTVTYRGAWWSRFKVARMLYLSRNGGVWFRVDVPGSVAGPWHWTDTDTDELRDHSHGQSHHIHLEVER